MLNFRMKFPSLNIETAYKGKGVERIKNLSNGSLNTDHDEPKPCSNDIDHINVRPQFPVTSSVVL